MSKIVILAFLFLQDTVLWACLATMAAYAKDLNTAETAYAAIDEVCSFFTFHCVSVQLGFAHNNSRNIIVDYQLSSCR